MPLCSGHFCFSLSIVYASELYQINLIGNVLPSIASDSIILAMQLMSHDIGYAEYYYSSTSMKMKKSILEFLDCMSDIHEYETVCSQLL